MFTRTMHLQRMKYTSSCIETTSAAYRKADQLTLNIEPLKIEFTVLFQSSLSSYLCRHTHQWLRWVEQESVLFAARVSTSKHLSWYDGFACTFNRNVLIGNAEFLIRTWIKLYNLRLIKTHPLNVSLTDNRSSLDITELYISCKQQDGTVVWSSRHRTLWN